MATEYESLRLSVSLTDNVTAQLTKIRNSLANLGGGPAGLGMERLKRQTTELTEHVKGLAGGFDKGSVSALGAAKSLGLATAGVVAMGAAVVKGVQSVSEYTTKMQELGRMASQTGIGAGQLKELSEQLSRQAGVSIDAATSNLAGLAHAMADITRQNSELRRNALRGLQGNDRAAMEMLLGDLGRVANDPAAFGNKVKEALDNVYANVLDKTKNSTRAAEARRNFANLFGAPDLSELQGTLTAATAMQDQMWKSRIADANELNKVTSSIGQSWSSISESVHALATPAVTAALTPIAGALRESAEQIQAAIEALRNFQPPEWMANLAKGISAGGQKAADVLNTVNAASATAGEVTRGALGRGVDWLKGTTHATNAARMGAPGRGGAAGYGVAPVMADASASASIPEAPKKGVWGKTKGLFGRAGGGDIGAGEMSVVGEKGPELFQPGKSGSIIPNAIYAAALAAEYGFGVRGASTAASGALRGHGGAGQGHSIGEVMAGGIPGAGILRAMKNDAASGHSMRSKLRAMLGLEDPGEPAPWQVAGRASGGPVTGGASYKVGEAGPELFMGGGGESGKRLVAEQTHQMQELVQNTEEQSVQTRALTDELQQLNRTLEGTGGIRAQGGPATGGGAGLGMRGLGGLPGFGGGAGGGAGNGSAGGGGASGSWTPPSGGGPGEPSMAAPTAAGGGPAPTAGFTGDRADFIEKAWPMAVKASEQTGVDPKIIMAQAALESNWGKSAPNQNYFGIKGKGSVQTTQEFEGGRMVTKRESFKGYGSMEESFQGYADFINQNKRYGELQGSKGVEAQAAALQRSGYATDPNYGSKIKRIASGLQAPGGKKPNDGVAAANLGGGHYEGDGHDHSHEGGEFVPLSGGVVNENQGQVAATRKLAIQAELKRQLSTAAAATGLEVDVFSGGQAKIGSGGKRTGSTRHDLGGAADVKLRDPQTGRTLDMRNPADQKRMAKFTEEAVAEGATGVGAGVGYMGASSLHIGGGSKASWGGSDWIGGAHKRGLAQQEERRRQRFAGSAASIAALDTDMDRSMTQTVKGEGKLTVDVNAPAGTKVAAEGSGLFKTVETNRQTQMQPAQEGPPTAL